MTRTTATPEPGFFCMRLTRGGPWVPALIYRPCPIEWNPETCQHIDRWPHLEAEIDGKQTDLLRVWHYGRKITEAEHRYLSDDRQWCHRHAPERLEAKTPRDYFRVDLMDPIF